MTSATNHGPESERAAADAGTAGSAAPGGWSAVVYGRTLRVDQWWRALPAGVDRQGPVGDAVRAAVAGGIRLEYGPRFLLHRDGRGVLIGVACELGLISRVMVQDRFGRPLYGFVGWYRPGSAGTGGRIPELDELAGHLADWAGPVYTEWIAPTWEAVGRDEAEPRTTRPVAAPWPEYTKHAERAEGTPGAAGSAAPVLLPPAWRPAHPAGSHLLPEADAPGLWAAAVAGLGRCVLVTGWRRRSDADAGRITHLTSADCRGYELLRPPPPPPPPPLAPAPPTPPRPSQFGPKPEQGPEAKPGSSGWVRGARGLGKLRRAVVDAFWSEDPEQEQAGQGEPERRDATPKRRGRSEADRPATGKRPGGEPPPGQHPVTAPHPAAGPYPVAGPYPATGRDPYDGLGEPGSGPARPAPFGGEPGPGAPRPGTDERPRWRTRSVDPKEANLSGMFGEFDDEPEPPPVAPPPVAPAAPAPAADPAHPATGEPS
ncbi:hypothetical protein ACFVVU_03405 [Kitasatospora sp. NPDC057965]|uniref:hypothetical protein n=1 Tax=Kitasatospora sp. NPDC057965 TaxID=3346291 RepID=UPI0036DC7BE5